MYGHGTPPPPAAIPCDTGRMLASSLILSSLEMGDTKKSLAYDERSLGCSGDLTCWWRPMPPHPGPEMSAHQQFPLIGVAPVCRSAVNPRTVGGERFDMTLSGLSLGSCPIIHEARARASYSPASSIFFIIIIGPCVE